MQLCTLIIKSGYGLDTIAAFYVIFAKVRISAVLVAIIGFAIIFAARAFNVIWNAVKSDNSANNFFV